MIEEEIVKKIREIAGEDAQIFAVVVQMKGDDEADYLRIASMDDGYLRCVLGAVDELKASLLFDYVRSYDDAEEDETEIIRGKPVDTDDDWPEGMRVRNLDGEDVEILRNHEVRTDRGVFLLKRWFYESHEEELGKLKENSKVTRETEKAYFLENEKANLWIPKSVIERVRS